MSHDPTFLPADLPVPIDDGRADHLRGQWLPPVTLASTDGGTFRVDVVPPGASRLVLYAYPRTGLPGAASLVAGWDAIPGARGCTPESCGFRDHAGDLAAAGAAVAGLSTQRTEHQREAVERLRLPFPLLADPDLTLTIALRLPTFEAAGQTLLCRLTLILRGGRVEQVFYPVFSPDTHAAQVLRWLREHPLGARDR